MASTEQLPDWIAANARQRRALIGTLIAGVLLHGLVYFNQRAMFTPWDAAEHPLVATTPSAFFAQVSPTGGTAEATTTEFTRPASNPFPATALDLPAGAPAERIGLGGPASEVVPFDLPDATPFAVAGADGGAAAPGVPGPGASVTGAPTAFVGPTSVPEISTWAMLLVGFGVVGAIIRRRRRYMAELAPI